jgi:hypothetical protein
VPYRPFTFFFFHSFCIEISGGGRRGTSATRLFENPFTCHLMEASDRYSISDNELCDSDVGNSYHPRNLFCARFMRSISNNTHPPTPFSSYSWPFIGAYSRKIRREIRTIFAYGLADRLPPPYHNLPPPPYTFIHHDCMRTSVSKSRASLRQVGACVI